MMAETLPSRYSKTGDTWEPVTGIATDLNGPVDLSGATLRFLAKGQDSEGSDTIIDTDSTAPDHGTCVNVEDTDGAGADIEMEWPVGSGLTITVPENRGRWRYEPTTDGVSVNAKFEMEVKATKAGKVLTFPNREEKNPVWEIDPSIA